MLAATFIKLGQVMKRISAGGQSRADRAEARPRPRVISAPPKLGAPEVANVPS